MNKNRFLSLALLYKELPLAFSVEDPKPLKHGIHVDIAEHFKCEFTPEEISKTLASYISRNKYQHSLLRLKDRFDLKGLVSGTVTASEKHFASRNLHIAKISAPEGRKKKRDNEKKCKALLLEYEEINENAKMNMYQFAASIGMKDGECESMLYRAKKGRADRLAERLKMVEQFKESGLTAKEFCEKNSILPNKFDHALKKVAEHFEQIQKQ
jgi:sRNA-binding protein